MVGARRRVARRCELPDPGRAGDRRRAREVGRRRVPRGDRDRRRPSRAQAQADQSDGGRAMSEIEKIDPEIYQAIENEKRRQVEKIELIASENYTSAAVMEAVGSVLTNKYAEGYPGRRYYGGCEWVDISEQLAIDRSKALFGAEHANVQPHSGAQANAAVYHALLEPGETIMGLSLAHGGHLTHGMKINVSGRLYD